jgi:hypothetical protein
MGIKIGCGGFTTGGLNTTTGKLVVPVDESEAVTFKSLGIAWLT